MKTVVGLFDSFDDARNVLDELVALGIGRNMIRIENIAKGEHAFHTHGESNLGDTNASLISGLSSAGVPREDAMLFGEGVRRGGTLIVLTCNDNLATRAYDILGRHGSIDLDERTAMWKKSGWTGFGETSKTTTAQPMVGKTELKTGEKSIPVIEEELKVGKREVQKGGIRVYSHVTEVPVQEQVHLREEHVHVERRPVDRPLSSSDVNALRDQTIEMREKSEEAVISKSSRVIEEVIIGKSVNERTETVRDTVKRTDVKVEKLGGETQVGATRFEEFDTDFRTHYNKLGLKDRTYDDFMPVYRYGHSLGTDERFTGRDWTAIEPDARRHWEERNPGTWEQFKDAIRYSWDRVRARR